MDVDHVDDTSGFGEKYRPATTGPQQIWEPNACYGLSSVEPEPDAEGDESDVEAVADVHDRKREVVLQERPSGLEICSATTTGHGAIITRCGRAASDVGMEPGTRILSINQRGVEDVPTEEIRICLHEEPLPFAVSVKSVLDLPRAKKMKGRAKDPVTVCTAHCRGSYRAVKDAIAQLGWKEVTTENRETSVIWLEHSDPTDGIAPVQTVTRLDAFLQMCRKAPLARCLNSWMHELPDEFTFVPETWILPNDVAELEAAMTKGKSTFIAKPSAGTQGKGIVLAKKWSDLNDVVQRAQGPKDGQVLRYEYVVQRYIAKPLLLDGFKFDMRIYVVVTSVVPLRAYLFKDGLARFCTVPYTAPKDGNLKDVCMHLTNFAVNKQSKDFQASDDHDDGSKRSVSSVFWQIEQLHGTSVAELWGKVAELTANTLMAIRPGLLEHYVQQDPKRSKALHPFAPKGFQIIGMDVLLDSELEPQLIELNANPALSVLQPKTQPPVPPIRNCVDTPPLAESPTEVAVGSALQAVRMVANSDDFRTGSGYKQDENASDETFLDPIASLANQQAMPRILHKLQQLSMQDLKSAEAHIDALLSGIAQQNTPRAAGSTERATGSADQSSLVRQTSGSPDNPRRPSKNATDISDAMRIPSARQLCSSPDAVDQRGRRSASSASKQRLGLSKSAAQKEQAKDKESKMVISPLDLEIKRELIAQALLLAKPAPMCKVARLRKQWFCEDQGISENIPLDDDGAWLQTECPQKSFPEIRHDAPDRCPCLEPIDFDELVLPEVGEYSRAHFALYRAWVRACGPGQSTVGQAQMLKVLERRGFVGPGQLFADRIAVQLWLTKVWKVAADNAFGLDLRQFVRLSSRLGLMLREEGGDGAEAAADLDKVNVGGVLEFVRRGGAGID